MLLTSEPSGVLVKVTTTVVSAIGFSSAEAEVSAISQSSRVMANAFAVLAVMQQQRPQAAFWY